MTTKVAPPTEAELAKTLGPAAGVWTAIIQAVEQLCMPVDAVWRPSKLDFGRLCLLQHKKRTLLYLTPGNGEILAAIVLGERAYGLAMASSLPASIKKLFAEARPYAEGRGIRFPVGSVRDIPTIVTLVKIKRTPK